MSSTRYRHSMAKYQTVSRHHHDAFVAKCSTSFLGKTSLLEKAGHKNMKILYQVPHLNTIYAGRTIYDGYKNAFLDLGHDFRFLTAEDNQEVVFEEYSPDILITGLHSYLIKYLDLGLVKKHKLRGLKIFVNTPFWTSPISRLRVNEAPSLSGNVEYIELIKSGDFGDIYYNACEQDDPRMEGFETSTGYPHYTVPLAADRLRCFPEAQDKFVCDVSFIGTFLPEKQRFIKEHVFPLGKEYDLRLYGQDWTLLQRIAGITQKIGQYFNVPLIKSIQKPALNLDEERQIYTSSTISLNIHEDYQKRFGGDCNERTFKIPACGGFEITDNVACISRYFREGEEIIVARSQRDWFDKIAHFICHPEDRLKIIQAGRERVLREHTYHNRAQQLLSYVRD